MLLEFSLENERAFSEESTLSLIASKRKEKHSRAVRSVGDQGGTEALSSALILGKNGSGKSSFITAFSFLADFVRSSAKDSNADSKLPFDPNLLCNSVKGKPTTYRVVFSNGGVIYDFGFSFNQERVLSEDLYISDKSSRFRKLYERVWLSEDEYDYSFGEALTGTRSVWAENTRKNALYLSTAVQLNSEVLKPAYQWLAGYLRQAQIGTSGSRYTSERCQRDIEFREKVVAFMRSMDINVCGFEFEEQERGIEDLSKMFSREFIEELSGNLSEEILTKSIKTYFVKKTMDGAKVRLPFSEESTGTQALYCLAGPLFDALENGYCLLIDEINTSLHPVIVRFLVDLFADEKANPNRAQLVFTSHDVSILRDDVLRRDQVWLIENDGCSASLIPLSDYSPRKDEALEKGYLMGRYGGIPTIAPSFLRYI